ncbi:hypothetical protein JO83_12960 [Avibacterium paragallinarum]|nr:hypothetical protein JO83_12960 [Avibacterium paragallinarum]
MKSSHITAHLATYLGGFFSANHLYLKAFGYSFPFTELNQTDPRKIFHATSNATKNPLSHPRFLC